MITPRAGPNGQTKIFIYLIELYLFFIFLLVIYHVSFCWNATNYGMHMNIFDSRNQTTFDEIIDKSVPKSG